MSLRKNKKGQLSIFLGIVLVLALSLIAFIVNIGLFVKARINFQNAIDSAAWSGAAVQARQLSNIGYLNWEMRNIYKEWMFKYYVVGQLSNNNFGYDSPKVRGEGMDFRLNDFAGTTGSSNLVDAGKYDRFNLPSICIKTSEPSDRLCQQYSMPGLPKMETTGMTGLDEIHTATFNALTTAKAQSCSFRTLLNFEIANQWAYGMQTSNSGSNMVPAMMTDRFGAWPKSLELALRIRNLEYLVNRAPVKSICTGSQIGCLNQLGELNNNNTLGRNERPIKAFMSAYRSLGGGEDGYASELKANFVLDEISPTYVESNPNQVNGILIPNGDAHKKYYLDLFAYPINFVTFFSSFISNSETSTIGHKAFAACDTSKIGLPVPSYILGFSKNPSILTYYAVEGRSKFMGLFYPFKGDGIDIYSYAAAKPFGGKIGPTLFSVTDDLLSIKARSKDSNFRSRPYLSVIKTSSKVGFERGDLIPSNSSSSPFWATTTSAIGGSPDNGDDVTFTIPNLLYGESSNLEKLNYHASIGNSLEQIDERPNLSTPSTESFGLYSTEEFQKFKGLITASSTGEEIMEQLYSILRPNIYESANYLIPTLQNSSVDTSSNGIVSVPALDQSTPVTINQTEVYTAKYFAPIIGEGTLYQTSEDAKLIIDSFIKLTKDTAIKTFESSIAAAASYMENDQAGGAQNSAASNTLYLENDTNCSSLTGKINHLFSDSGTICGGIYPLSSNFRDYINDNLAGTSMETFYVSSFTPPSTVQNSLNMMTAYFPTKRWSVDQNSGVYSSPFSTGDQNSNYSKDFRNFYSTKLIPINAVANNSSYGGVNTISLDAPTEGSSMNIGEQPKGITGYNIFKNYINPSEIDALNQRYGSLDF